MSYHGTGGADHAARVYQDILQMLPDEANPSPMVRINRLSPRPGFDLYAKLEWMNPFGSVKDRAAWAMLRDLEAAGKVSVGTTGEPGGGDDGWHGGRGMVEPTSGNTGISLAAMASLRGYGMRAIVPDRVPEEKKIMLRLAGADVDVMNDQLCPSPGMGEGSIGMAKGYARAQGDRYVMPNQYENQANARAHEETTGPEIWRQTRGSVTHVFVSLGTCGTATGLARYLRGKNSSIKIIAVQPTEGHDVPGLRNRSELHVSKLFDESLIDEIVEVDYQRAYTGAMRLCRGEGLFAGPSSGLIFEGACDVLSRPEVGAPGGGVGVAIFCDSVFKYLSKMVEHLPELRG